MADVVTPADREAFQAFARHDGRGNAIVPDAGIAHVVVRLRDLHEPPVGIPAWDAPDDPLEQQIASEIETAMLDAAIAVARRYGWTPGVLSHA